jgi:serine/threonine protein kinase/tetratricopeptide (TPR) repeat protein
MTLAPGTKLGRYEIRSKIGEGGMGEVYRALDTELGRTVAIKILPERLSSDQQRLQRFIQEARSASALNHPHIITIFEIGQADALRFIVSEFIDGDTLRQRIGLDPVNLNEVIEIGTQAASALSAAHAAGIIHRDIKPENIMVRRDGYVKLLDFGLAKLTEPRESITDAEAPTKALVNTDAGTVMGTANYMSPEQAKGITVDARTDLWSLGAVLYEMITGHLPFAGETPTETISLILQKEPASLKRYANEVPAELERIVTRALTKDREQRYQTAKDMLIDLRNLKRKLEVDAEIDRTVPTEFRATPSTSGGQSAPGTASGASGTTTPAGSIHAASSAEYLVSGIKQHKIAAAIVVILLVLGGVGFGVYWHARNTEVAIESIAVLPFVNTSGDANTDYLSDGITESLINSFSQLPGLRVIPRGTVFRYKGKETDPVAIGKELGVRALLTGRVTQRGDNLSISVELVDLRDNKQLWGEQYERKASDLLAMQHDIAQEITGNLRLKLSGTEQSRMNKHYTENPEAYQLYLKGRYFWNRFSPTDHQKAAQYFNQAIAKDPTYALAYTGLADTYGASATNGWIPSTEAYPKAMAAVKKALELDETLAEAHCTSGALTMFYLLDWATAEREYKRAIELNPNYSETFEVYSYLLTATGRLTEAIEIARRGSELDPLSIPLSNDLGQAYYLARRYDEAIKQYQKTNEMDPSHNGTYSGLGYAYDQKGMYAEAIASYQKGIALSERTTAFLAAMGHAYAASGRKGEALKILDEMKEVSKQKYVSPYDLAILYTGLGDKDQAIEQLNKAYEEHAGWIIDLKVEPKFDPLRSDPRFADLIRRLGLPQ